MTVVSAALDPAVEVSVTLRDGSELTIRPMHRTDAGRLVRFHHTLSPETTRLRFFTFHPELRPDELDRFTHVDHNDREAIVATVDDEIVGVGRWDRADDASLAEVAFVVTDAWQGRGLGSALLRSLVEQAPQRGIDRFLAVTLTDNRRMLAVFHRAGKPVTSRFVDGQVELTMDLRPSRLES